jgi:hypothetical protein
MVIPEEEIVQEHFSREAEEDYWSEKVDGHYRREVAVAVGAAGAASSLGESRGESSFGAGREDGNSGT